MNMFIAKIAPNVTTAGIAVRRTMLIGLTPAMSAAAIRHPATGDIVRKTLLASWIGTSIAASSPFI